jgi:hypothetical protein
VTHKERRAKGAAVAYWHKATDAERQFHRDRARPGGSRFTAGYAPWEPFTAYFYGVATREFGIAVGEIARKS